MSTWQLLIILGVVLAAQVVAFGEEAAGRIFYVDSATGDDDDTGRSPGTAWASLERVNGADVKPGDTVLLKRGGVWRGTLVPHSGEEGNPVTYAAYGEGEKPLLLGSVSKDGPADWTRIGDNVWVTATPTWTPKQVVADLRQSEWHYHREQGATISTRVAASTEGKTQVIECQHPGSRWNHIQAWGPEIDWEQTAEAKSLMLRLRARCTKPFRLPSVRIMRRTSGWSDVRVPAAGAGRAGVLAATGARCRRGQRHLRPWPRLRLEALEARRREAPV